MQTEKPVSFVERSTTPNPLFKGFETSNIVEAEIREVHTDEANNVNFTATVVTIKGEVKHRLPFLFPYASEKGDAGIFVVPQVGDQCLVALAAGNSGYIIGYHPAVQVEDARASTSLLASSGSSKTLRGTFAKSQLIPGSMEMRTAAGNRILMHPGGSIAIDAKQDLFTFYDAVSSTIESLCRSMQYFTAGGFVLWDEGKEKTKPSMSFQAEMFTKSATKENVEAGPTRGGAHLTLLFSEKANYFLLSIEDQNGIKSKIAIGPGGIILTSGNGVTQGSIAVSPNGNFSLSAGDPNGIHTQLDLAPEAIAITALNGPQPLATVQATGDGAVVVSGQQDVKVQSDISVEVVAAEVGLGSLGGLGVVRALQDQIMVFNVQTGTGVASGFATTGSAIVTAAG